MFVMDSPEQGSQFLIFPVSHRILHGVGDTVAPVGC